MYGNQRQNIIDFGNFLKWHCSFGSFTNAPCCRLCVLQAAVESNDFGLDFSDPMGSTLADGLGMNSALPETASGSGRAAAGKGGGKKSTQPKAPKIVNMTAGFAKITRASVGVCCTLTAEHQLTLSVYVSFSFKAPCRRLMLTTTQLECLACLL
jgi:hypothetical protein